MKPDPFSQEQRDYGPSFNIGKIFKVNEDSVRVAEAQPGNLNFDNSLITHYIANSEIKGIIKLI